MIRLLSFALILGAAGAACDRPDTGKVVPPRRDLGTGLNTVNRTYARPVAEVWTAALGSVQSHEFALESQKGDKLGGQIVAHRATGDKVTVTVSSVDESHTEVSVRVAPGDRNMATMLHDHLSRTLGVGDTRPGAETEVK